MFWFCLSRAFSIYARARRLSLSRLTLYQVARPVRDRRRDPNKNSLTKSYGGGVFISFRREILKQIVLPFLARPFFILLPPIALAVMWKIAMKITAGQAPEV